MIDRRCRQRENEMKTSAAGRQFIEQWEGLFLHTYDDGTGTLTIGYGHTTAAGPPTVRRGMVITKEQADAILASDLAAVEIDVNHHVIPALNQNQFDALVSFDFNTGGLDRSSVLRAINLGRFEFVHNDLLMWDHGGGRFMQGLYNRRLAEAKMFNAPVTA